MTYIFPIIPYVIALTLVLSSSAALAQEEFSVWLEDIRQEALASGISDKTSTAAINHIEFIPDVVALDRAQPEFISPFLDYYYKRVDANKIQKGRELIAEHYELLSQIEAQYGVPKALLIAFWGMETQYGSYQGDVDTLSALATLAYEGRRADFFRDQLFDAMRMIEAGQADMNEFRGSWAGAFGNMQFMPATFILYAVDGDEDGKIDVVNSLPDAFASAASYLSQVGWRIGEPTMIEVHLPENFDWKSAQITVRKPVEEWSRLGVRALRADADSAVATSNVALNKQSQHKKTKVRLKAGNKKSLIHKIAYKTRQGKSKPGATETINLDSAALNVDASASILLPQGWRGPAFMVFDNFDVVMDWNRSVNYALSVVQLAKRLKHESRLIGGQFAEEGALTFQEMFELQSILNARGFDAGEPDGLPGLQTQAAVRAYQLMHQLPSDGYASPSLHQRLFTEP